MTIFCAVENCVEIQQLKTVKNKLFYSGNCNIARKILLEHLFKYSLIFNIIFLTKITLYIPPSIILGEQREKVSEHSENREDN